MYYKVLEDVRELVEDEGAHATTSFDRAVKKIEWAFIVSMQSWKLSNEGWKPRADALIALKCWYGHSRKVLLETPDR